MLRKYKNQLPEFLKQLGFGSNDFTFLEKDVNFTLTYQEGPMKFSIYQDAENFDQFFFSHTRFTPDFSTLSYNGKFLTFKDILEKLRAWYTQHLEHYIYENHGPDELENWEIPRMDYVNIQDIDFESNDVFTSSEKELINQSFVQIGKEIEKLAILSSEQTQEFNKKLAYLTKCTEKGPSKTDWKNILIGTLLSTIVGMALTPDNARLILEVFKTVFSTIPSIKTFFLTP